MKMKRCRNMQVAIVNREESKILRRCICTNIAKRLCNSVLHGAPTGSIQKLQRVQNTAARIGLQAPRRTHAQPLLEHLHWLPVHLRIDYKLAVLTYNVRSTGTPSYLSRHIKPKISARHLRSSSHQLLQKPTTRTHFADRTFRCTAPTVWRSLNSYTVDSGSLSVFKSRLKTFLFRRTFHPV